MGVTGLWKLIETSGKPVPLETLEGKVLAVDISIWLHQVVKGYQDGKGGNVHNAHIAGLFNRICKLLYFRIKPVFVFDGKAPILKKMTIQKRSEGRTKIQSEKDRIEHLLLETLAKEKIVIQALGDPEKVLSPLKSKFKAIKENDRDNIFKLPEIKEDDDNIKIEEEEDDEEMCPKQSYDFNIHKIDITSSHFKSLPADMRHDILFDLKETRKQSNWGRLRELPVESTDFCSYQMTRLLKRRQIQLGLEEAEKEMGGKTWSLSELESLLTEDGVLKMDVKQEQKIASSEHARFILVRDIANAMDQAKKKEELEKNKPKPSTSKASETLEDEEDYDLQRAIQLSLIDECDDEKEIQSDERIKLNPNQRQKFGSTIQSHGLVRGFMMEYAEMNDDDIKGLMESTQVENEDTFQSKFSHLDEYVLNGTQREVEKSVVELSDNESDDEEFVDVSEKSKPDVKNIKISVDNNLENFKPEEDIFADIFKEKIKNEIPDVEVASISSDDTVIYELPENYAKENESGFVSEDQKNESLETQKVENSLPLSENEKLWKQLPRMESTNIQVVEKSEVVSENEKFWSAVTLKTPEKIETKQESSLQILADIKKKLDEKMNKLQLKTTRLFGDDVTEKSVVVESTENTMNDVDEKVDEIPIEVVDEKADDMIKVAQEVQTNTNETIEIVDDEKEIIPQPSTSKSVQEKTPLELAHESVTSKTEKELRGMQHDLADEHEALAHERNKLERVGQSITKSMSRDCKELLKLFGIPYIDSPMEAEAQCAFLNLAGLSDGTITDDSDIFLFGGKRIYKNFFVQQKMVMEFVSENVEDKFHLDRKKMIQLAMLVGSDYTLGVNGIGAVTALEILAAFPETPEETNATDIYQSLVSSLRKFREWVKNGKKTSDGVKIALKSKLKNIELSENFPNIEIARAYLEPEVDDNKEPFSWGTPDKESLVEYTKNKLGWTRLKTEEILDPVIKKMNEKKQATIKDYFKSQVKKKFHDNSQLSKRVQQALNKMKHGIDGESEVAQEPKEKVKRPRKKKVDTKCDEILILSDDDEVIQHKDEPSTSKTSTKRELNSDESQDISNEPLTSKGATKKRTKKMEKSEENEKSSQELFKPKKAPTKRKQKTKDENDIDDPAEKPTRPRKVKIPDSNPAIPQREKDKLESEMAKKKAIEVFKKSKNYPKK